MRRDITLFRTAYIYLDQSSYSLHPDLFKVHKYPDMRLFFDGINQGLQEFATYNPPGPTKPGGSNPVCTLNEKVIVEMNKMYDLYNSISVSNNTFHQ